MLDDIKIYEKFCSGKDLELAELQCDQTSYDPEIINSDHDNRKINSIIFAGMGGSALSALFIKSWLKSELKIPFEIIKNYDLPECVDNNTLVIASSYSGNTEETVSCLIQAIAKNSQVAIIASGGELIKTAKEKQIAHVILPEGYQPRMAMIYTLCSIVKVLSNFGIIDPEKINEISDTTDWLKQEASHWNADVPTADNYAKQLALFVLGKSVVFFSGTLSYPVAYKWKTCFNETAKNLSFLCEFPEFNHNEILGWTSHPIEKPFATIDMISNLEHPQILKRFEISDQLLSGQRPKTKVVNLVGDTLIKQLLWGSILADYVSIYLSVLNSVDPMSVQLIEKLKIELVQ